MRIVISNSMKQRYWPEVSALGKRIYNGGGGGGATVVGVVGDVHDSGLGTKVEEFIYHPMLDSVGGGVSEMTMVLRTEINPASPAARSH